MNRAIEIAAMFLGGTSLFAMCFLGFAVMSGVPLNEVAVIGRFFPEQAPEEQGGATPGPSTTPLKPDSRVIESNLGVLGAWSLPSPYTPSELQELTSELKIRDQELDIREDGLLRREEAVKDQLERISQRMEALETLRRELEEFQSELVLREQEVLRDERVVRDQDTRRWNEVATVLARLDGEVAGKKLQEFSPEEAAQILRALDPERAAELLNLVDGARWRDYVEAYTAASQQAGS